MSKRQHRIELPLEAEPARDFIEALVARYERRIDELTKQVESLTEQVQKLTPRNSSLPPSTEHPHAKPEPKKRPGKKRKQGGQKGHKRHSRVLVPAEQCTSVTPCHPDACRRCGGDLQPDSTDPTPGLGLATDPADHRRIPTLPWPLPLLRHHNPGQLARRSAHRTVRPSAGRLYRIADGTLSPE